MDLDTQRKEEWCISLQFFLASRLRTPSYHVASRQHPFICVPPMIPRSQFLLDGIVWAVNDHPDWALDAWLIIQNHIKDTATRYAELSAELAQAAEASSGTTTATTTSSSGGGTAGNVISATTAPRGSTLDRERIYQAHAAVQDVYLSFCVMDALVKNVCAEAAGKIRPAVEAELPYLVAYCVPVFAPATCHWVANATEEFRYLFHALLDSWLLHSTFSTDVHRRLQEYMLHRLQRTREEEETQQQDRVQASGNSVLEGNSGTVGRVGQSGGVAVASTAGGWSQSVQQIIDSTARISAAAIASAPSTKSRGGSGSTKVEAGAGAAMVKNAALRSFERGVRTPETVERTLRSFLNSIFPPRDTATARHRCPHCGALFRDDKSRSTHYRCHFYARNFLKPEEKLVRLMYPSAADFADHAGDLKREGSFTRTVEVLEEAYKGGARGAVKIRRLEEPPDDATDPSTV